MTTRHTPGPWVVEEDYGTGEPVVTYECRDICRVDRRDGAANARLIAAAPDMAEALQALFEHCAMVHNKWGENCNRKEADAAIAAARAALEKAGAA